jgi:hypothetical protein
LLCNQIQADGGRNFHSGEQPENLRCNRRVVQFNSAEELTFFAFEESRFYDAGNRTFLGGFVRVI